MTYQHILLTTDGSNQDWQMAEKAQQLATLAHAKLSLIHVIDAIPMPDTSYGTIIPLQQASDDELLNAEKQAFTDFADRLSITPDSRWLVFGVPVDEIIDLAKHQHVDLIIVGLHSRHGLARLLTPTANKVLQHAPCDVLAIRC